VNFSYNLNIFDINNMSKSNAIDKNKDEKVDKLQKILDEIRNKYGKDKIMYADMIRNKDKS
jgi:hypothetical protein